MKKNIFLTTVLVILVINIIFVEDKMATTATSTIPRTSFQTNCPYDERIDLKTDIVIVHRHDDTSSTELINSWKTHGYRDVYKMFFIGSDAGNGYTSGRFDSSGRKHMDEVELGADGNMYLFCGERPYMVPTDGWIQHLKNIIKTAIDAGATGICPEEPLAHTGSGYSDGFKREWKKYYNEPWKPPHSSPETFWKANKLHSYLYLRAVRETAVYTKSYAKQHNCDVKYICPTHCVISHAAGGMVFPCGEMFSIPEIDGVIAQVWTGPIAWSLGNYEGKKEDRRTGFFESAFILYSYFANLSRGINKGMYFLTDPVEDDPNYGWGEYADWYEQSLIAELMFPQVYQYEVMPWPDRIFLPGYHMGEGTPGPARYLTKLLLTIAVLQDIGNEKDIRWETGMEGIAILVSDTIGWQRGGPLGTGSNMDSFYGLILPLLKKGIPVQVIPVERIKDKGYLDEYKIILLSYDMWKPLDEKVHDNLISWVENGGILLYCGSADVYNTVDEWWKKKGYSAPYIDLFVKLKINVISEKIFKPVTDTDEELLLQPKIKTTLTDNLGTVKIDPQYTVLSYRIKHVSPIYGIGDDTVMFEKPYGKGMFIFIGIPAKFFCSSVFAGQMLRAIVKYYWENKLGLRYDEPGYMKLRRGHYIIGRAQNNPFTIEGKYIDLLSSEIPLVTNKTILPGENLLLYDISDKIGGSQPCLLYTSHKIESKTETDNFITFTVVGPKNTFGVARIYSPKKPSRIIAGEQQDWSWEMNKDANTLFIKFANRVDGRKIEIVW